MMAHDRVDYIQGLTKALIDGRISVCELFSDLKRCYGGIWLGSVSSWMPVEILEAFQIRSFTMNLFRGTIARANAHLPSFCCHYSRGFLEMALKGSLEFLDGVVFTNLCDSIQNLIDIWRGLTSGFAIFPFYVPVVRRKDVFLKFMVEELRDFKRRVVDIFSLERDFDLIKGIEKLRRKREIIHGAYMKKGRELNLSQEEFYTLIYVAQVLEPDEIRCLFDEKLATSSKECAQKKLKIFLVGTGVAVPDFFKLLDELGIFVVDDYLCFARGYWGYEDKIEVEDVNSGDGFDLVAELLALKCAGAVKLDGRGEPGDMVEKIISSGVDAVVFVLQKFCEPWHWQMMVLRDEIEKRGVRTCLLELSGTPAEHAMIKARLEAFVEMFSLAESDYYDFVRERK